MQIGLVVFGVAAVLGSVSTTTLQLILSRGAMGIGAALVFPATLAILTNVFIPYRATLAGIPAGLLDQLPREDDNQIVRQTAHFLFGRDHSPSLYHTGLRRQGLVQIFHDFCLIDRSRCATCPFPNALRNYRP